MHLIRVLRWTKILSADKSVTYLGKEICLINTHQKELDNRIAKGCGRSVEEVNRLLKQFEEMKKVMGKMAKGGMPRIPGMRMPGGMR